MWTKSLPRCYYCGEEYDFENPCLKIAAEVGFYERTLRVAPSTAKEPRGQEEVGENCRKDDEEQNIFSHDDDETRIDF